MSGVLLTLLLASTSGGPLRAQFPNPFKRGAKPNYLIYKDPAGRFTLEYPAKDWRLLSSGGSVLVAFNQKDGDASVFVDYMKLRLALAPEDIDSTVLGDSELQTLKERHPTIADVKSEPLTTPTGPRIVFRFTQPGANRTDLVTQYSIPIGADLYRLVCTVRSTVADKYQPILAHMVETFTTSRAPQ